MKIIQTISELRLFFFKCILIRTYADLNFLLFEVGIRFVSVMCASSSVLYDFFLLRAIFPLQSYWSLSRDRELHCTDELM